MANVSSFVNSDIVTPGGYFGRKIEFVFVEKLNVFGEDVVGVYWVDPDTGEEFALDGIPHGAYWDAEVISDLTPFETARNLIEEMTFYGSDEDSQEFLASVDEKLNLGEGVSLEEAKSYLDYL